MATYAATVIGTGTGGAYLATRPAGAALKVARDRAQIARRNLPQYRLYAHRDAVRERLRRASGSLQPRLRRGHRGARHRRYGGDEAIQSILDAIYARAPYTVMRRAMHIHPTVSELSPTMLDELKPLGAV